MSTIPVIPATPEDLRPVPTENPHVFVFGDAAVQAKVDQELALLDAEEPGKRSAILELYAEGRGVYGLGLYGRISTDGKWSYAMVGAHTPESGWVGDVKVRVSW